MKVETHKHFIIKTIYWEVNYIVKKKFNKKKTKHKNKIMTSGHARFLFNQKNAEWIFLRYFLNVLDDVYHISFFTNRQTNPPKF